MQKHLTLCMRQQTCARIRSLWDIGVIDESDRSNCSESFVQSNRWRATLTKVWRLEQTYANDASDSWSRVCNLFADDVEIFWSANHCATDHHALQIDVTKLPQWLNCWQMSNKKCKERFLSTDSPSLAKRLSVFLPLLRWKLRRSNIVVKVFKFAYCTLHALWHNCIECHRKCILSNKYGILHSSGISRVT